MADEARLAARGSALKSLRLRRALGRIAADDYAASLRGIADELAARQLELRPELNARADYPQLSKTLFAFDRELADALRKVDGGKVDAAAKRLVKAERHLAKLETYRDALGELALARQAPERQVSDWKLQRFAHSATFRALRKALDVTGRDLVRQGFPGRARALARLVQRELAALSEPTQDGQRCRVCAARSPERDVALGDLALLPAEASALAQRLSCDRATEAAWQARKRALARRRVSATGTHFDELSRRARELAERAKQTGAELSGAYPKPEIAKPTQEDPA